jgi:hypothetical protein
LWGNACDGGGVIGWGVVLSYASPHYLFWREVVNRCGTNGFALHKGGEHTSVPR